MFILGEDYCAEEDAGFGNFLYNKHFFVNFRMIMENSCFANITNPIKLHIQKVIRTAHFCV